MSSIQQRFILQRSLNPIAPRPYGLVALQKVKQGSCFKILSKSSSASSQNNEFESVTVDLPGSPSSSSSSSPPLSAFHDLSESPRTLYDYLFRRFTWNINNESAEVSSNANENEVILLPPQFLFLKTESTFYVLSDPKSIARQIFDARPVSEQMEHDEMDRQREENELFDSLSVPAKQTTQPSDTNGKKTTVLRNSMLLNHLLSINDSCSIPVPAVTDGQAETLDVNFFRAFPQLLQEYEFVSAQNENCRVELVTEEEYQHLFFDDANNASSGEDAAASQKQTSVIVGHDEHGREIRRLGGKDLTREDRLLKKLKQEFNIGDVDADSGEFTPLSGEHGAGDVSYEARMKKRFENYDEKRTGKNSAGSPYFKREARRKLLKGETTGDNNSIAQEQEQQQAEEELLKNYGGESESSAEQNPTAVSEKLHLILRVTRDIPAGSEFFLCYGREYWTHFTGACVFTSSLSLPRIRWAEKYLLGADRNFRDLAAAFPDLTIGRPKPGQYYLVDRLSESAATDEAVVAEFVRRIAMPPPKESEALESDAKTATGLFREMLNQTAHRLLEANLRKIMISDQQNENGEAHDESQLVQKAAQAAARDGTEGLLKQELNLKRDVRMLLAKDILAGKKKKVTAKEE